jgi:hypothetical protein
MKRPTRADPAAVTRRFVDLASALLTYLIEWLILRREAPSFWLARGLFGALLGLWFGDPIQPNRTRPCASVKSATVGPHARQ